MTCSSREMQRRLIQPKAYYKLFHFIWKETSHKPLKVSPAKKYFLSLSTIDTTCFNECFLFQVITGRHYILYKFRFRTTSMLLHSLKQVFWIKSALYIHYLYNNITMLLKPKVQKKILYFLSSYVFLTKFIC